MNWQDAVSQSKLGRAFRRRNGRDTVRYRNGDAYIRNATNCMMRKAAPEEVEGFDDWVTFEQRSEWREKP